MGVLSHPDGNLLSAAERFKEKFRSSAWAA